MTKNEILIMLKDLGNEKRKQMYIKNGASENTYGVLLGELRKIAKKLGKNHELGLELWNSENTDAKWLACMMMDGEKLSLDEIKNMVSNLTYSDIIDKFIAEVVCNSKYVDVLAKEWGASSEDNLGRAGWKLIVYKIANDKLDNADLEDLLKTIESELQNATKAKQWAMNHTLCQIGISYLEFTDRCINLGETLGVYKELKVAKGCTSAYAPNWINAVIAKQKR